MPPWQQDTGYCSRAGGIFFSGGGSDASGWTSDNVFCVQGVVSFWQTSLYIALAFWGFFTVLQLFTAFDIRHSHGHALARAMQHLMRQGILFFLACGSFFLMLLAHQLVFLISNALVGGGLPQWRVDALWGHGYGWTVTNNARTSVAIGCTDQTNIAQCVQNQFANFANTLSGGNMPGQNQVFGLTWSSIWWGLGYVEDTILQAVGSIRFLIMLLLVGMAPLAIVASGFDHFKRAVFFRWLELWLELEGLAILTALAIAGFNHVVCPASGAPLGVNATVCTIDLGHHPDQMNEKNFAFLMLGFAGIISGLQLAYVWRFIGQVVTMGTNMYQQDYNRNVASAKAASNALSGVLELGGAAISLVAPEVGVPMMIAGGVVSNVSNTVQSAIPQANGYGGSTMGALPDMSGAFQNASGGEGSANGGDDGGGGGGDGGGGGGPVAFLGRPQTTQNGTTQAQFNISNRGMSVVAMRYANTSGAATSGQTAAATDVAAAAVV